MKRFKWVVEFEVDETWVADGFDLTDERAKRLIEEHLDYSHGWETAARVISHPPTHEIAMAQGYLKCPRCERCESAFPVECGHNDDLFGDEATAS